MTTAAPTLTRSAYEEQRAELDRRITNAMAARDRQAGRGERHAEESAALQALKQESADLESAWRGAQLLHADLSAQELAEAKAKAVAAANAALDDYEQLAAQIGGGWEHFVQNFADLRETEGKVLGPLAKFVGIGRERDLLMSRLRRILGHQEIEDLFQTSTLAAQCAEVPKQIAIGRELIARIFPSNEKEAS